MRSFPEVKWVFFCCCFVHFCPFGQSKLRQFAIVWLHIQSSCMWHWVHNTPPPKHTSTPPLWHNVNIPLAVFQVLLAQRENLLNSGQIFDQRLRVGPRLDDHLFFTAGFGSGYLKKKKKKIQDSSVYRHSGPFIRKMAVLIQLRESSWTIQEKKTVLVL